MGWLIALTVLLALGCIPVGIFLRYDSGGCMVKIILGALHYTVFPLPKRWKKAKESPQNAEKKAETPPAEQAQVPREKTDSLAEEKPSKIGSIQDFFPLIHLALDFLNHFRRKLRMDDLRLIITLGGDDPCDLAVNYGRTWEALGNLLPRLERVFRIGKRNLDVQCDFTAAKSTIEFQTKLTLTLGQITYMGIVYGSLFLKEFLVFRKKRKGGSVS